MARVISGTTDVPTAGTQVRISNTPRPVMSITFKALVGNTGNVYFGDSNVEITDGFELAPGEAQSVDMPLNIDGRPMSVPISDFFVNAATNGDDVCWVAILNT